MENSFGYTGKILRVDLSTGSISHVDTANYASEFLGGRGLASKIYWDEVPPETTAFDAQNRIIFATGPMAGVRMIGGSRWAVCAKTSKTTPDHYNYCNLGGTWGAELKFAGYDALVVQGVSEKPVYLLIKDNTVELRDAAVLWGKGSVETRKILKNDLGKSFKVVAIGPAGENMVTIASIHADNDASGSAGMGAVLGSKKLKAVVVNASERSVNVAQPERIKEMGKYLQGLWLFPSKIETPYLVHMKPVPDIFPKLKKSPCYGCPGCVRKSYEADNGKKGKFFCHSAMFYQPRAMKYYGKWNDASFHATRMLDEYGIESHGIDYILNWMERCYEAGILNDNNTGLKLSDIGSLEFLETLLDKISNLEGFGGLLAQGLDKAAEYFGPESADKAKQCTYLSSKCKTFYGPRLYITTSLFYAMEPRLPIQHLHEISIRVSKWLAWNQGIKGAYFSSKVFRAIAKRFWGSEIAADFSTYEGKALAARKIQDRQYVKDSLALCDLLYPVMDLPSTEDHVGDPGLECRLLSLVTGDQIDEQGLNKIGERLFNLQRAILVREGHRGREDDIVEDYYFTVPLESDHVNPECLVPGKDGVTMSRKGEVLDKKAFEGMKDEFYSHRNWNVATGLQTREALEDLDLHDVARDLEQRCMLG
ncbi:MAG: hypothetical protein KKC46_06115 [Proteobacteria bacterium]|nr:hypothetical protein [Pseudomonadota bacterium]